MASIGNDKGGRRRIVFDDGDGRRKTIRLGRIDKDSATSIKAKIESLITARITGDEPAPKITEWLASIPEWLHDRIARTGLAKPREQKALPMTLKPFLEACFASLKSKQTKATTIICYDQTRRCLLDFYGDVPLSSITPLDAEKFPQHLRESGLARRFLKNREQTGLAEATVSRRTKVAKSLFAKAVDWDLILKNPFAKVTGGDQSNEARAFFIDAATARKVLDACPDARWRLIFSMARWGGIRCPSELTFAWSDVNFEQRRIWITSPKTLKKGKPGRWIPMFPELEKPLMEMFEQADEGAVQVISGCLSTTNLRSGLLKIIRRAGVSPWPRLFHNLRASRQTELAAEWPSHVVCRWLGNSERVAQKHYLQVRDEDFERATGRAAREGGTPAGGIARPIQDACSQAIKESPKNGDTCEVSA